MNWKWILMENMALTVNGYHESKGRTRDVYADIYYKNQNKGFRNVKIGADIKMDKEAWK